MGAKNNTINYIEFPLNDVEATKAFYNKAFGWEFQDFGPDYISFTGAGIDGGFNRLGEAGNGVLVVLYADDLMACESSVKASGANILKPIFEFPGGRRFHFEDPNGNEVAVWSE